ARGAHADPAVPTRMQHVADVVEPDARAGDVERAAQADHDVVQEHRPELAQAHRVDRGTRLRIERPYDVDVGDPQRVALHGEPLRLDEGAAAPRPPAAR